jgi:hypothetical protein
MIIVPVIRVIITTQAVSNLMHTQAEAADLAEQALETAQYDVANGVNPTPGITTTTQHSGKDAFTVAVDFQLASGTSAAPDICVAPPGQLSSQIWTVSASVSWGGVNAGHVAETTLVSPSEVDLADTSAGEIAVPVYNSSDVTLETATPIALTVTGTCTLGAGACGSVPSNEVTTESANTGTTGCAVFPNLFAGGGETYNITVAYTSPYVDPNEVFYNAPSNPVQFYSGVAVQPNVVTIARQPHLILAPGAASTMDFETVPFALSGVTTTSGSASVTHSGGFPGVANGMAVSGSGIPVGTAVSSGAGTSTLTLSAAATATGSTSTLFFTGATSVAPAPYLAVTVQSSTLLCSTLSAGTCVVGNGTAAAGFSSTSPQTALLYPGPPGQTSPVAGLSTTANSVSVTLPGCSSSCFPSVAAGMDVSGAGIAVGTVVGSISGNTLKLSQFATATATAVALTFSSPNYVAWAGNEPDNNPSYGGYYGSAFPASFSVCPLSATSSTCPASAAVMALYSLSITVTSHTTVTGFTATDTSGSGGTLTLNGDSGTFSTGLPLGEYEVQATDATTNEAITYSGASSSGLYVWVLPTGVCWADDITTDPTSCTPSTSPISVSVA